MPAVVSAAHQDDASLLQVPDQPLGDKAHPGIVSMMDARQTRRLPSYSRAWARASATLATSNFLLTPFPQLLFWPSSANFLMRKRLEA
jgi:hypothetical protein